MTTPRAPARRWRVVLSIAWFTIGLAGVVAAAVIYGWSASPAEHLWHAAAWVPLMTWVFLEPRLLWRGARR